MVMRSSFVVVAAFFALPGLAGAASAAEPFSDLQIPAPSEVWRLEGDRLPGGVPVQRTDVPSFAFAVDNGVNVRNRDWSIAYQLIGGAFDITYNSFASHVGWFGRGWGSPLETRLIKMRDGTIFIQLNGTGAVMTFARAKSDGPPRYATMMDDVIAKEAAKAPGSEARIRKRLETQKAYAIELATRYNARAEADTGLWRLGRDSAAISPGCDETGYLAETPAGYVVNCKDHRTMFDPNGNLLSGEPPQLGAFEIVYSRNGRPVEVRGERRTFGLVWGDLGVEQVVRPDKKADVLEYDSDSRLLSLRQPVAGFSYRFEYNDRTDLTAIRYGDGTSKTVTYDSDDAVTSLTERNGERTLIQVERDKRTGVLRWDYVSVLNIKPNGDAGLHVYRIAN